MTTIGIIGAGQVGQNIATAAIANGYDVVLSNLRGPESMTGIVRELGSHASAATPEQAAAKGNFAVVAIPMTTLDQVPVEPPVGKVVITTTNYFPDSLGHVPEIDSGSTTVPGLLQQHLPKSKVVRAFNMINAADMSEDGYPRDDPSRRALALSGDDVEAKKLVAHLYDQFGFDALDTGGLDESWRVDAGRKAFVTRQSIAQLKENVANAKRP